MSQDIRKFFQRTPGKGENDKSGSSVTKKKRRYIESDSDEDLSPPKKKSIKDKKTATPKKKKNEEQKKKKYVEVKRDSLQDIFGEKIHRINQPERKIESTFDDFDDEDVFEEFMKSQGDETDVFIDTSEKDKNKKNNDKKEPEKSNSTEKVEESIEPSSGVESNKKKASPTPMELASPRKSKKVSNKNISPTKLKENSPVKIISPKKVENGKIKEIRLPEKKRIERSESDVISNDKKKEKDTCNRNAEVDVAKKEVAPIKALFVEKYKPTSIKQIVGQMGPKSNVNKLLTWLSNWHSNQSSDKKIPRPSPWAKDDNGAYFKAALLSGPPGVGKTTSAHLVCKELNMDVVEMNASDTRSKKLLDHQVGELLTTKSLSTEFTGKDGGIKTTEKRVLIMDEVDGMAGNEDRGGVQELILLIKNTKVPIICMCNDRNHPKIRSLANHCFDLRFSRPRVDQIKAFLMSVAFKEKVKVKPEMVTNIITNSNNDIRLSLNHLSMLAVDSNDNMKTSQKDIKLGPWDVLKKIFSEEEHKKMSIHDKSDLFFNDYSIIPLFVQENYLSVVPHSEKGKSKIGLMRLFARASLSIAQGDIVDQAIRNRNAWGLLPTQAMLSSVIPGDVLEGHMGGQINFPLWLGKNSRKNKMDRLTQEIQSHARLRLSGSKEAVALDYAVALRDGIIMPLVERGSEAVENSLTFMKEYSLLREDLDSLNELCTWQASNNPTDPFSRIESKVKAAFTRAYNRSPVVSSFTPSAAVSKKKGKKETSDEYGSEGGEEDDDESNLVNQDDISLDGMIMVKKSTEKSENKKSKKAGESSKISKSKTPNKRGRK